MKHRKFPELAETIPRRLAALRACSIPELKEQWRELYGSEPPHHISRELLTRAVAYRIQEKVYGGLKASTGKLLLRLANEVQAGRPLNPEPAAATPAGTVLIREWHGVTHEVRALDRGVLYKRKHYGSLTKVAQLITGAHWNGPQFFGLRSKQREASHGSK